MNPADTTVEGTAGAGESLAIAFLGSVVSNEMMLRLPAVNPAGDKFQAAMVRLLRERFAVSPGKRSLEAAAADSRIVYWRQVPNAEVVCRQRQATVLRNARPSSDSVTRYTFPSKLREYMLSGRPAITTLLPGIPAAYYQHLYVLHEDTSEALARLVVTVCEQPRIELREIGRRAREFTLKHSNAETQGQRIYDFICTL
ncbi:MAG: hypothetical protein NTY19_06540 [Planctomycetota bacterium]|nr:hypothetical protein [Planctomycetota bacterium]